MSKFEFIITVAEAADVPATEAKRMVDTVIDVLSKEIVALGDKEKLNIIGFGSFAVSTRAPRVGRNPQTGEPLEIKQKKVVNFRPASALKAAVSGAKS